MLPGGIPGWSRLEQLGRRRGVDRVNGRRWFVTKVNHFYNGTNEDETAVPDVSDLDGAQLVVTRAQIAAMVAAEVRRARAVEEQRQREARTQVSVERLAQEECMELEGGRPSLTLPAEVSQMILDNYKAGHSKSSIWRKYSVYYPFSRAWLTNALADGRLQRMAERDSETP